MGKEVPLPQYAASYLRVYEYHYYIARIMYVMRSASSFLHELCSRDIKDEPDWLLIEA